ncbi:chemokine XC receptor 1-like [Scomber scombrus]|uniref:Chemokine XC receptor 1-like n=1 Tax=Scomber scombrus TaxID=13677 RepID=A0AAV1NH12_SCOSC
MANNSTDDSGEVEYLCDLMDFSTVNAAFFIVIFIISVTGNSLLLVVLVCHGNLKNATNLFVLNLACSDLLFAVTLPFWAVDHLHHWVFGDLACKFLTSAYYVGLYSSTILLTAITVDRFITVVLNKWPSKPVRERCAVGVCAAAWIISVTASLSDAIKVKESAIDDDELTLTATLAARVNKSVKALWFQVKESRSQNMKGVFVCTETQDSPLQTCFVGLLM